MMLIGWKEGLEYAVSRGAGWRADCWGDMDTTKWNHMGSRYPKALKIPGVTEAWKKSPVALETCWTFEKWYDDKWDIDYILGKALEWHASEVNNGSEAIPEEWWGKTLEFEKKLGYRFVLKKIAYPVKAGVGKDVACEMEWENKGVAPVYNPYDVSLRLTTKGKSFTFITDMNIRSIYPGTSVIKTSIHLPASMESGKYKVELGVVKPGTAEAAVKIANEGKTADGWYSVGEIEIGSTD